MPKTKRIDVPAVPRFLDAAMTVPPRAEAASSKKRQSTKSRSETTTVAASAMGDLAVGRDVIVFPVPSGFERDLNFSVPGGAFLTGDFDFLQSCDFKELRVAKNITLCNFHVIRLTTSFGPHSSASISLNGYYEVWSFEI